MSVKLVYASERALKVNLELKPNHSLYKPLRDLAKSIEENAKQHHTQAHLNYWQQEAKHKFKELLAHHGYFAANVLVTAELEQNILNFSFNNLVRYKLGKIKLKYAANSNHKIKLPKIKELSLVKAKYVTAPIVSKSQSELLQAIEQRNCLLNLSVLHTATINHPKKTVDIHFIIEAGPITHINAIQVSDLVSVKEEYAKKLIALKPGQCFKQTYIMQARRNLQKSNLFATTTPKIVKNSDRQDNKVDVEFHLKEKKHRSIKAGVNYSTDLGMGLKLGWEHRNFFGQGEQVEIDIVGNNKEQLVSVDYTQPFFYHEQQKLKLSTNYENKKTSAFANQEGNFTAIVERKFWQYWQAGLGSGISFSRVNSFQETKKKNYALWSIITTLGYDTRDNILDPHSGHNINLEVIPYFSLRGKKNKFFKHQITASKYLAFKTKLEPVIALKGRVGAISGVKKISQIPVTERFFAGGSNSVRGYAYQTAGMLNEKRPIGGQSIVETSIELRFKVSESVGLVTFFDSGVAYDKAIPDVKQKLFHGYGVGLRYLTNFGPLRFDIGLPMKKRKSIDKNFQIYFGIGQAF